ncbi:peroxidase [Fusarium agapanthi]|uniref:Peroxidase n=1 Tax=Fusarium agapanthi TaxID=1803897 RepID=A0A9P5BCS9_9HYPO|nr:peroxidase [Fusarium agapanthi]
MKGSTTLAFALVQFSAASQPVWPSKWDEVEDLLYLQGEFNKRALRTCEFGSNNPGQQNTAEWLRKAFKADPNNDTSVPFQKDITSFHNGGHRDATFHSDNRIFDNDKATMKKLSTKAGFNSMCADILTRMIDTVPKSVQLTPVLEAYDMHWTGPVRIKITNNIRDPNDLAINLIYAGRDGKKVAVPTQQVTFQGGSSFGAGQLFANFQFDTTIDAKNGLTKFWIQEVKPATKANVTHDNQKTGGYKIDDTVFYQLQQSCAVLETLPNAPLVATAMVRDARPKDPLTLRVAHKKPVKGSIVPKFQTEITNFKATGKKSADFTAFQAKTMYEKQNT